MIKVFFENILGPFRNKEGNIIFRLATRWPGSCNRCHDQRATEQVAPLADGWGTCDGILTQQAVTVVAQDDLFEFQARPMSRSSLAFRNI